MLLRGNSGAATRTGMQTPALPAAGGRASACSPDFLGVGGGFLLMPALVKFARLPLRVATGTSLAVIACNSAAGFVSHLGETPAPWLLAAVFSLIAAAGVLVGGKVASKLPEKTLRTAFAVLVSAQPPPSSSGSGEFLMAARSTSKKLLPTNQSV